jgi:uncharacterized protein YabN with tetrapyrrole methylase and pyrophosphatase domain
VFGEVEAENAADVLRNWDSIKAETEGGGLFGDLPKTLPSLLYAKKIARRAERAGREPVRADAEAADIGARLFELVEAARTLEVDPELALREYARQVKAETEEEQADQ